MCVSPRSRAWRITPRWQIGSGLLVALIAAALGASQADAAISNYKTNGYTAGVWYQSIVRVWEGNGISNPSGTGIYGTLGIYFGFAGGGHTNKTVGAGQTWTIYSFGASGNPYHGHNACSSAHTRTVGTCFGIYS